MFPKAVTLITLGVADLARARAFYAALGWEAAEANEGVIFIQLAGQVLALFGIDDLAKDMARPRAELGTGAATLAVMLVITPPAKAEPATPAARAATRRRLRLDFWITSGIEIILFPGISGKGRRACRVRPFPGALPRGHRRRHHPLRTER